MGTIMIWTDGSFGRRREVFAAREHGHADAVARAIEFLAGDLLPVATADDHRLHDQGDGPSDGWDRRNPE